MTNKLTKWALNKFDVESVHKFLYSMIFTMLGLIAGLLVGGQLIR